MCDGLGLRFLLFISVNKTVFIVLKDVLLATNG